MTIDIISRSISTKVWDWAGIELETHESAVRLATNCTMGPGTSCCMKVLKYCVKFIQETH